MFSSGNPVLENALCRTALQSVSRGDIWESLCSLRGVQVARWAGFGTNGIYRCTESGDSSPLGHCLPFNLTRLMRAFRQTRKMIQPMHSGTRCKSELCVQRALVLRLTRRSMHSERDSPELWRTQTLGTVLWTRKCACPLALFSARQARASEQQEIAFRSTGSVSDFSVTPDGISGRLYKTNVLDISVARAFAATPPGHLADSRPTLFQVAQDSQRCSSFCLLRAIRQTGFGPRPLDSGHQGKSEICKHLTYRTSDHSH